jgi:gentisate 1,2-dioxygenase
MTISEQTRSANSEMEAFYDDLRAQNLDALWRGRPPSSNNTGRKPSYAPHHWAWEKIEPALMRAGQLVTPGPDAERRVIQLIHPELGQTRSASHTLTANVQLVLPGEISPSHRHTTGAIRFIIEGKSAISVVDGEPIAMYPGDLVLTPGGYWHGHINESDRPAIWMDSLDRPITAALRQAFQEPYGETLQARSKEADNGFWRFGAGALQPVDRGAHTSAISPIMRYPWEETRRALDNLAKVAADPFDDIAMDYTNPLTGRHVLPTIGCRIQMLRAGVHTRAHRHAHVSVYHAFRGAGVTIIENAEISWRQGDFFVVPPWSWHEHVNPTGEPAFLFSTIDAPVLDALNLAGHEARDAEADERHD